VLLEFGIDCIGVLVQLATPQIAVPYPEVASTHSLSGWLVPYLNRLSGLPWARARTSRFWKIQVRSSDPTTTTSTSDNAVKQSRCRYENTPRRQDDETVLTIAAVPKVFPHQAEACACAEAEPPHPSVDSPQDWQHHQVRPIATLGCSRYRPNGRIDAE
jgi:hypothetical protein